MADLCFNGMTDLTPTDRAVTLAANRGLAAIAAMSPSAFHRHFKSATALSPVQFQKRIRLLQARLLLVSGGLKASDVAFDVGYESATQFSREYARFFGAPPAKDAAHIFRHLQQPGSALTAA